MPPYRAREGAMAISMYEELDSYSQRPSSMSVIEVCGLLSRTDQSSNNTLIPLEYDAPAVFNPRLQSSEITSGAVATLARSAGPRVTSYGEQEPSTVQLQWRLNYTRGEPGSVYTTTCSVVQDTKFSIKLSLDLDNELNCSQLLTRSSSTRSARGARATTAWALPDVHFSDGQDVSEIRPQQQEPSGNGALSEQQELAGAEYSRTGSPAALLAVQERCRQELAAHGASRGGGGGGGGGRRAHRDGVSKNPQKRLAINSLIHKR